MSSPAQTLTSAEFENLRRLDTCTASNAIERFDVRLRNEGFVRGAAQCQFPELGPMLGYAAPAVIRSSTAPMTGRCYYDRMDWWEYLTSIRQPRVLVLQDVDPIPGLGALIGGIHAGIAMALRCVGCLTNGSVRDLPQVKQLGFHLFAGGISVSHAYAHIVEFGEPVEIGGLKIRPGELLHGDVHGVHLVPLSIAARVPEMADRILDVEQNLMRYCRSSQFSLHGLGEQIERMSHTVAESRRGERLV